jgi:hypothetical protein
MNSRKEVLPSMSVKYCADFSQNTVLKNAVLRGIKAKRSLNQSLANEARVSQGEETRQLAPQSSSDQVKSCLNAKPLTATFLQFSGGSS